MEFFKVGSSKIKIILSKDEAEERGVSADGTDNDRERRNALRKILEEAEAHAGFFIGGERVLVQIYPTSDGGVELFVTKLGSLSGETRGVIARSERVTVLSGRRVYYIFSAFEDMLGAARCIPPALAEKSTAYALEGGEYCLSFYEREKSGFPELLRILEFGSRIDCACALPLVEHSAVLAEGDAVERLSVL